MLPISDILIRSISGYVFIIPVLILYFFVLKKSGRKQSVFHIIHDIDELELVLCHPML